VHTFLGQSLQACIHGASAQKIQCAAPTTRDPMASRNGAAPPAAGMTPLVKGMIALAVIVVVGVVVGVVVWQVLAAHKRHEEHGGSSGSGDSKSVPVDPAPNAYHPPAPTGLQVTGYDLNSLLVKFNTVPTPLVSTYQVQAFPAAGDGAVCPAQMPLKGGYSMQVAQAVAALQGKSTPLQVVFGNLPTGSYCVYVEPESYLMTPGKTVGTSTAVTTAGTPPPPPPPNTLSLTIAATAPSPPPLSMPPTIRATITPFVDTTNWTIAWIHDSQTVLQGPFNTASTIYVNDVEWQTVWYAVACPPGVPMDLTCSNSCLCSPILDLSGCPPACS